MDDKQQSTSMAPKWSMTDFGFHPENTDCILWTTCNGRRVVIHVNSAEDLSQSPSLKERYMFFLTVAEAFELDGYTVEDLYEWLAAPLLPFFDDLEHLAPTGNTLENYFHPEVHYFRLMAKGDALVAVASPEPEEAGKGHFYGVAIPDHAISQWPTFKPSEIKVYPIQTPDDEDRDRNSERGNDDEDENKGMDEDEIEEHRATPSKVILPNGTIAFFKIMRPGDSGNLLSELNNYQRIHESMLDRDLHISRLLGLVQDEDSILGLLLTFIDGGAWSNLHCAVGQEINAPYRMKWAEQVEKILTQLHKAGVIWGDAKPDNVFIDKVGDAWLIDFGGGYTEGWVTKDLAGTIEGDLEGLRKIKAFLNVELI